jgi:hypothetical protein
MLLFQLVFTFLLELERTCPTTEYTSRSECSARTADARRRNLPRGPE